METHENIKRLREERGLSQEALASKVGYSDRSSIAKIESGKIDLSQSKIAAFAAALNVSPAQLMGLSDADTPAPIPPGFEPMPEMERVPLVGRIACGEPITAEENVEDYVAVPTYWHATFTLRCCGDSMEPTVHDGDLVAIRKETDVVNGQIYAVRIGDEAMLKHVYRHQNQLILQSENPAYPPVAYAGQQLEDVTIEGKAVGFCRNL